MKKYRFTFKRKAKLEPQIVEASNVQFFQEWIVAVDVQRNVVCAHPRKAVLRVEAVK